MGSWTDTSQREEIFCLGLFLASIIKPPYHAVGHRNTHILTHYIVKRAITGSLSYMPANMTAYLRVLIQPGRMMFHHNPSTALDRPTFC